MRGGIPCVLYIKSWDTNAITLSLKETYLFRSSVRGKGAGGCLFLIFKRKEKGLIIIKLVNNKFFITSN